VVHQSIQSERTLFGVLPLSRFRMNIALVTLDTSMKITKVSATQIDA
jgi:hypothetical protein